MILEQMQSEVQKSLKIKSRAHKEFQTVEELDNFKRL